MLLPLQEAVSSSSSPPPSLQAAAGGSTSRRSSSQGAEAVASSSQQQGAQPEQDGVQVAMLRSMSNTRIAKFNRLLGEQVRAAAC